MSEPNPLRAALVGLLSSRRLVCESCDKPATHGHNQGGRYCWECGSQGGSEDAELYELQEKPLMEQAERALAAGPPTLETQGTVCARSDIFLNGKLIANNASPEVVALLHVVAEALGARVVRR